MSHAPQIVIDGCQMNRDSAVQKQLNPARPMKARMHTIFFTFNVLIFCYCFTLILLSLFLQQNSTNF